MACSFIIEVKIADSIGHLQVFFINFYSLKIVCESLEI